MAGQGRGPFPRPDRMDLAPRFFLREGLRINGSGQTQIGSQGARVRDKMGCFPFGGDKELLLYTPLCLTTPHAPPDTV